MALRVYYLAAALGFALSAYSSAVGNGPKWPNHYTFTWVAALASVTLGTYAIRRTPRLRRLAVASVVVASGARAVGWVVTLWPDVGRLAGSVGVFVTVAALMLIVNAKARRLQ